VVLNNNVASARTPGGVGTFYNADDDSDDDDDGDDYDGRCYS
jgi:hypothetical protein